MTDIKSQDDLGQRGRSVDVLTSTIDELERTKKQLEIAKETLKKYAISDNYNFKNQCYPTITNIDAIDAILKIEELDK